MVYIIFSISVTETAEMNSFLLVDMSDSKAHHVAVRWSRRQTDPACGLYRRDVDTSLLRLAAFEAPYDPSSTQILEEPKAPFFEIAVSRVD